MFISCFQVSELDAIVVAVSAGGFAAGVSVGAKVHTYYYLLIEQCSFYRKNLLYVL